jgi:tetratricopeptide (TPR) repeat protein
VVHLKKATTINSSNLQARLYLGRSYLALGKLQDALQEFQAAMRIEPKNVDVLYSLGQVYGKLMSEAYVKLAEADPESYRIHQVLAESYQAQKDTDKAIQQYRAAILKAPETPGLRYGLGDVYWRTGMLDDAMREFLEELKINPEDYMSIWKLGNIYLIQSRWDDAIPLLEKAVQLQPDLAQAYRDLGKAYFQKDELQKAIAAYTKVVKLAPDEDTVHYRLANIYKKLGRNAEAEVEMKIFETLNKKVQASRNPLLPSVMPEERE